MTTDQTTTTPTGGPPPRDALAARSAERVTAQRRACDYCGVPIVWATTTSTDTAMPVDADPTDGGNVLLTADGPRGLAAAVLGRPAERAAYTARGYGLHLHHRLSCPFADEWSRPGGPKRGSYRTRLPAGSARPAPRRATRRR